MRWSTLSSRHELGFVSWVFSFLLLLLPAGSLALLAVRADSVPVAVGAGVLGLFFLVFLRAHPVWRPPVSVSVAVLYLVAFVWAWVPLREAVDWLPHIVQGVLLLGAVGLLAVHDLRRTGAEPLRRANRCCRQIVNRTEWPMQLGDCRTIPEAVALREAVQDEAGPALALLSDPRPEVQTAALGSLEYRPYWRVGEAELILKFTREGREPAVRVAAIYALASVGTPDLIAGLASFLRDPAAEVRRAAAEALLWDAENRWPFARDAVKESLADARLANDGALFTGTSRLPAAAVADLITWATEHPPLAGRAILTLTEHYHTDLLAAERPELANELAVMMLNNDTPPALRVELAALLRDHHLLSPDLLDRLTNLDQPAPIRLFAAELMLQLNPHDPDGVDVLRGLARQPNRELAVRVGSVLQNVLGLEMGLPPGDLPAPNSKPAADVSRRVLAWANGASPDVLRPTPGPRPGLLPGSRQKLPALSSHGPLPGIPPTPPPRGISPLDDSLLVPPPPSPLDESMLAPPRSVSPLDDDSLLAPPREFSPLDDSLLAPPRQPSPLDDEPEDSLLTPPRTPAPPARSPLDDDASVLPPESLPGGRKRSDSSAVF